MKNLLKFAFYTLFCVMLAASCDPEVHDGEAKLNSLVFTVSANPSLGSDCVATINGTDITVVVPEGVSLVGLVPTFTVTINDVVSVGSALVTSGETPCNFSSNAKIKVTDTAEDISTEYSISFQFNDGTAELKNFGFYKADNSSLDSDYLAESIADEMIIRIPEGGSGKSLVAKFEAGFGDVVTVDGQEVSGTVTVDCTFPIDIVVTDPVAGASKAYVVKVGKILQMVWERVGELSGDYTSMRGDVSVAINPKDNVPYFAILSQIGGTSYPTPNVVKFENNAFSAVGAVNLGRTGTAACSIPRIAFDKDGALYAFYGDGDNSKLATVSKYSGSDWSVLGQAGWGSENKLSTSYGGCMLIDPKTNTPAYVYTATTKNTSCYRTCTVSIFDGSAWSTVAPISGMPTVSGSTAAVMYYSNVVNTDDAAYFVAAANQSGYQLIKYADKSFSIVASYLGNNNYASKTGLAADSKKNIYLLAADKEGGDSYDLNLSKYDSQNGSFAKMASTIATGYSATSGSLCALGIDKNDVIYAAYSKKTGDDQSPYLASIDPETKDWTAWTAIDPGNTVKGDMVMTFSADGTVGYLAYVRNAAGEAPATLVVYRCSLEEDILPE